MKSHRERKITLRSYKIEAAPLPTVDSKLIRDTRKGLRCSRVVFARKLRINERALEKWGARTRQAESPGSRPRPVSSQLSRHAGAFRTRREA
jgi:DNA-binding transcriptional regulator YiaG